MEEPLSGWVRFDNRTPDNLKVERISDRAHRLWFNACCYCSRAESDGFVPATKILLLSASANRKTVDELLDVGLLEAVPEGYLVHDYLNYNPSRRRIAEMREGTRERVAKHREGRSGNGVTDGGNVTALLTRDSHARDRTDTEPKPEVVDLNHRLAERIRRNDPKADPQPDSRRWLTDMRLLVADRGGDVEEVARVIDWCQADAFWRSNILSPAKLRKQFTQLLLKSQQPTNVTPMRENASSLLRALDGGVA